ncbi:competence protein ComK [Aquibacillus sediminis]|uniref:competence protein ComK n=1 Tax=Aquibacillus sediminis TaxID=2574734 RepID=UPI0011096AC7|nr:competence protein ComK [Aquibacillus sediminis]
MTNVLIDYHVNEQTIALLPATHIDYDTIVLEVGRKLYVKKTPLQLIKQACLAGGASYDGRRKAVIYQMGVKRKVPIPICPQRKLFAYPTQSPSEFNCHWIFYHHVQSIRPNLSIKNPDIKTIITFKNGEQIFMNESYYVFEKQMQRTAICILYNTDFQNQRFTV